MQVITAHFVRPDAKRRSFPSFPPSLFPSFSREAIQLTSLCLEWRNCSPRLFDDTAGDQRNGMKPGEVFFFSSSSSIGLLNVPEGDIPLKNVLKLWFSNDLQDTENPHRVPDFSFADAVAPLNGERFNQTLKNLFLS